MTARRLTPLAAGVEVTGVDLVAGPDSEIDALRAVVERHGLVVLRGQPLEPGRQLRCTGRFGHLQDTPAHPTVRAHPGVTALANRPSHGFIDVGGFWHADGIFLPAPSRFSVVSVKAVPASGATTHVVDTVALHAGLPPGLQARAGRTWVRYRDAAVHPLVVTAPGGDPAVYASAALATAVHGPDPRATGLLAEIDRRMEERGAGSRVTLHRDDVLIWDNLRIAHRAGGDADDGLRLLHRTTTAVSGPDPHHGGPRPRAHGPGWSPVRPVSRAAAAPGGRGAAGVR